MIPISFLGMNQWNGYQLVGGEFARFPANRIVGIGVDQYRGDLVVMNVDGAAVI